MAEREFAKVRRLCVMVMIWTLSEAIALPREDSSTNCICPIYRRA